MGRWGLGWDGGLGVERNVVEITYQVLRCTRLPQEVRHCGLRAMVSIPFTC